MFECERIHEIVENYSEGERTFVERCEDETCRLLHMYGVYDRNEQTHMSLWVADFASGTLAEQVTAFLNERQNPAPVGFNHEQIAADLRAQGVQGFGGGDAFVLGLNN